MASTFTSTFAYPAVGFGESGRRKVAIGTIAYTAQAYSNGLAAPASLFGFTTVVESLIVISGTPANATQYKWDSANQTIRIYPDGGTVADVEASGAQTVSLVIQAIGW